MTRLMGPSAEDLAARREALDPQRSFIVQAPAGSGKTELLTQRLLALLSCVDAPEEILAITFTRKAAAEMRGRLLKALQEATGAEPEEDHARQTWKLARAALARADERNWDLLHNPARLQLQTIDSFCSLLTRRMPWLSRFGAPPRVCQDPSELYKQAAEQLLGRLENDEPGGDAVALLLDHLDNQLSRLRDMLVALLARRDQWLRCLLDQRHAAARARLEQALQDFNWQCLSDLRRCLGADLEAELLRIAETAATHLADNDEPEFLERLVARDSRDGVFPAWDVLLRWLLTDKGEYRRRPTRKQGFPAGEAGKAAKHEFSVLVERLRQKPGLAGALKSFLNRPAPVYQDAQWHLLDALIDLLPLAVAELTSIFRQRGEVDFIEVAGAALIALGSAEAPEELLLQFDARLRHILVDEFQDTSCLQYELLHRLTAGWQPDDGRTLFLVGDPMQSIYRFRQAEVGYFLQVCSAGLGQVRPVPLRLSANFRSRKGVVEWVNSVFSSVFPNEGDLLLGAVPFARAMATREGDSCPAVDCWAQVGRDDEAEAERVVELVQQARQERPGESIAILVRARNHLEQIIPALRRAGLVFQAQDLDSLEQRPLIQDLRALTRALLHPADRVSWLAVLRAPWCGLSLKDLQQVIGSDRLTPIWTLLHPDSLFPPLSKDGEKRWQRIRPALAAGLANRGRVPLRTLVETTWLALAGPACVSSAAIADAESFFQLLEELDCGGDLVDLDQLDHYLEKLFAAPDPEAGGDLQLMTIHKAKGLEFDTVILPGLGRPAPRQDRPLLNWLDHPEHGLLLAPMRRADSSSEDATYRAIQRLQQKKDDLETDRLLYVAVTRAVRRVHLLGHLKPRSSGDPAPDGQSLLARLWEHAAGMFSCPEAAATEPEAGKLPPQTLCRLPLDWQRPQFVGALSTRHQAARSASGGDGQSRFRPSVSPRGQENRITGNVIHQQLEMLAAPGKELPDPSGLQLEMPKIRMMLQHEGIPAHRLEACSGRVLKALVNTFCGDCRELLFTDVTEVATELALHGMLDGTLVHAVIDRTFVDAQGCRWILDYKTSHPGPDEDIGEFLRREADRYAPQLSVYARLFAMREPDRNLRLALYFPLLDRLHEVEVS